MADLSVTVMVEITELPATVANCSQLSYHATPHRQDRSPGASLSHRQSGNGAIPMPLRVNGLVNGQKGRTATRTRSRAQVLLCHPIVVDYKSRGKRKEKARKL